MIAVLLLALATPAFARGGGGGGGGMGGGGGGGGNGWHTGGGGGGGHGHGSSGRQFHGRGFVFGFAGYPFWGYDPFWGYWGYPYYDDYAYAPNVYAAGPPTPQSFWYFCPSSNAYYPYVKSCRERWEAVPATPPPMPGPAAGYYNAQ